MSEPIITVEVPLLEVVTWCLLLFVALLSAKPGQRLWCVLATGGAMLHSPFLVGFGLLCAALAHGRPGGRRWWT